MRLRLARAMVLPVVLAILALVTLWAFVSYLHPSFTGELGDVLICN